MTAPTVYVIRSGVRYLTYHGTWYHAVSMARVFLNNEVAQQEADRINARRIGNTTARVAPL